MTAVLHFHNARAGGDCRGGARQIWRDSVAAHFLFKFGIVALLGPPGLTQRIGCAFAVALAIGGAILLFWPN